MPISKWTFWAITTVGGTLSGGGGVYLSSIQSIETFSQKDLLPTDDFYSEEWKMLQQRLNTNDVKIDLTSAGLNLIQNEEESGSKLKEWCQKKKDIRMSAIKTFRTTHQQTLVDSINWFCALTIVDKISNPASSSDLDRLSFQKNLEELKKVTSDTEMPEELKAIKNKQPDKDAIEDLVHWCTKTYARPYRQSNLNLLESAKKYCQKNS